MLKRNRAARGVPTARLRGFGAPEQQKVEPRAAVGVPRGFAHQLAAQEKGEHHAGLVVVCVALVPHAVAAWLDRHVARGVPAEVAEVQGHKARVAAVVGPVRGEAGETLAPVVPLPARLDHGQPNVVSGTLERLHRRLNTLHVLHGHTGEEPRAAWSMRHASFVCFVL